MEDAVILSAVRTPIGDFGGGLAEVPLRRLGAIVIREALRRAGVAPEEVDDVLMGNVLQAGQGMNPARQASIDAGLGVNVPATTLNMVCGSGLRAVATAVQMVRAGDARVVVAGGMESMSRAPYLLPQARWGYRMGHGQTLDAMIHDGLWCALADCHMGNTAENLAVRYEISREEQDAFALESHRRAARAWEEGRFAEEVVPVEVRGRKGEVRVVERDEHFRPDTSLEALARLRPAFQPDGTVTAGNASGINDGASAVVVASARWAQERGLRPMARVHAYAWAGVEPEVMGIGPVPAIRQALKRAGLTLGDIDLIELNEAFAAQSLAVARHWAWTGPG